MAHRHLAAGVSLCLCVLSLLLVAVRGLNFGLDFTGGTLVEVTLSEPVPAAAIREYLADRGFGDVTVQQSGGEREILLRVPVTDDRQASSVGERMLASLREAWPGTALDRADFIGPSVGEDMRDSGLLAAMLALATTGIYIGWRFTGKFAAAATIALAHDVVITMGAFAAFQWRFDLASLAAVLTVIGYSLNDTIVICDRIRETLRVARRISLVDAINEALNHTLERTVIMSLTTLSVLLALLLFGGEDLRGFAAALTVGVIAGTYSSIYIAAAYLVQARLSATDLVVNVDREAQP